MTCDKNGKNIKKGDTVLIRVTVDRVNQSKQDSLVSVNLPHPKGMGQLTLQVEPESVELAPPDANQDANQ